jgi:hypothetical protein
MTWTDDPVRDAERYETEKELADRNCLHCFFCGGTIWDGDDYFDLGNMVICEDCLNDKYRRVAMYD